MDSEKRAELKKVYEEEISDSELLEMACAKKEDYENGVYELLLAAVEKRGLEERLKKTQEVPSNCTAKTDWVEVYRYYYDTDRDSLEAFLVENNIPVDIVSGECPAYDELYKPPKPAGMICVPSRYLDAAQKVVTEFKHASAPDGYFVTDEVLRKAISDALDQETSGSKEKIINAIIQGIGPLPPSHL